MNPRLGINIDHVATLRQAREEGYPSLVDAARVCLENGADQITVHLREDRRHIQDTDVGSMRLITKKYGKPLNFEMGAEKEIVDIAIATNPDWVCLVPEKRQEKTTEGGLNLLDSEVFDRINHAVEKIKSANSDIKISLFLESNLEILKKAELLKINAVEIHTGDYARDHLNGNRTEQYLDAFQKAHEFLKSVSVATHAGHGLTRQSVLPLLKQGIFHEYNIGHWVICQSVFDGLSSVVRQLKMDFDQYEVKL